MRVLEMALIVVGLLGTAVGVGVVTWVQQAASATPVLVKSRTMESTSTARWPLFARRLQPAGYNGRIRSDCR